MTGTVGTLAGAVWTALNENGAMASKDVKKAAGLKSDKELYLAMGWLLREDKLIVVEDAKTITLSLK
ncbi:MAG: winged helix-turn-helix domain-containing protein [Bacteroidaceae bacterium]|nr:winged helix-turn-helix domain-containing protein [Bacteroidaceae bacterium]MBR6170652.1 winged helix-turn-helix domain-containing protein [Bacteroidaceae bacterium]